MTPEEKAVINAALKWWKTETISQAEDASDALQDAVAALVLSAVPETVQCPLCTAISQDLPAHMKDYHSPARTAETLPCWECTDPDEDPAPWCDCREPGEQCKGPCRKRAHAPERCPNLSPAWRKGQRHCSICKRPLDVPGDSDSIDCGGDCAACMREEEQRMTEGACQCSRTERVYCHAENCHGGADVPEWVTATFLYCLAGDQIRLGTQETDVIRSSSGIWHANNADAWHPTPWRHTELRMELAANPGFQEYPPNTPVEILMTPERLAVHTMMLAFPGSVILDSSPVDK